MNEGVRKRRQKRLPILERLSTLVLRYSIACLYYPHNNVRKKKNITTTKKIWCAPQDMISFFSLNKLLLPPKKVILVLFR